MSTVNDVAVDNINLSSRKEITSKLQNSLEKYLHARDPRVYWSREVTFDYSTAHPIRVDYMKFLPVNNTASGIEKGDFCCYEIKSCIDDFNSKNGHNFIGDYNYYVMTQELFEAVTPKIPYNVGVLVPAEYAGLSSVKKAKRVVRDRPVCEMLLMMFRSANRDRKHDD